MSLYGQNESSEKPELKNAVKLNVTALVLKNISVQYERAVGEKVTLAGTVRYMPESSIPLKSLFKSLADDPETEKQIDDLRVGNVAFMPEVRYYVGKQGAFRGFYIGAYGNIANYTANVPLKYDDDLNRPQTIQMSGDLTAITGGLMLGAQFKMSNKLSLDWWILGPNYGTSNGNLTGKKNMNALEQQALRNELENLDIPLTKFTYEVNSTGATMDFKGPWAGIRAGICLGFRF